MHARLTTVRQLTQPAVQNVVIDAVVSGNGGDRHAGDAAGGNQLGLEFGAVSATATANLGELVVGKHVSTLFCVDTMLLDSRRYCQMGWPDAYRETHLTGLVLAETEIGWNHVSIEHLMKISHLVQYPVHHKTKFKKEFFLQWFYQ
jgi:hypothetical protein